jgi:hypothetical protein
MGAPPDGKNVPAGDWNKKRGTDRSSERARRRVRGPLERRAVRKLPSAWGSEGRHPGACDIEWPYRTCWSVTATLSGRFIRRERERNSFLRRATGQAVAGTNGVLRTNCNDAVVVGRCRGMKVRLRNVVMERSGAPGDLK